ncbi:hypothetical protein GCM10009745_26010 [Kribbella yunnanensis]|uniref:RNA polymerase sigma factor 70 region 4 type 2 domain-containing protein n=1 Tax=Kribbella yunnanensis TaxID=190194 RepID=A0ABN2H261_9ACTN
MSTSEQGEAQDLQPAHLPDRDPATAADRLRRRQGDQQLLNRLRERGFRGIEYEMFADELARYAIPVLCGWMFSGYIFPLAAERGFRLAPTASELDRLRRDPAVREELASMTVAKALGQFRSRALVGGGWNVDGGASLTTYFTGSCVFVFPNEFRRYRRAERQDLIEPAGEATAQDPAGLVAGNLWVDDCLAKLDPRTRAIVELSMNGYSHAEIVDMLDETSVRAVEGVLHRFRTTQKARLQREGE